MTKLGQLVQNLDNLYKGTENHKMAHVAIHARKDLKNFVRSRHARGHAFY